MPSCPPAPASDFAKEFAFNLLDEMDRRYSRYSNFLEEHSNVNNILCDTINVFFKGARPTISSWTGLCMMVALRKTDFSMVTNFGAEEFARAVQETRVMRFLDEFIEEIDPLKLDLYVGEEEEDDEE